MDTNELWLLDSVSEQTHPVALLSMDDVQAIFDRPNHGMGADTLTATLLRLFDRGWLCLTSDERGEFQPTPEELEAALASELDADFGLTAAGGEAWSEISKPDWNRFIDGVFGANDEDGEFDGGSRERVGEFCCADEAYLKKFMAGIQYRGIAPHVPSLKWDTISPFQALYWKQLPSAHRVRFMGVYGPQYDEDQIPEDQRNMGVWHTGLLQRGGCGDGHGSCDCG